VMAVIWVRHVSLLNPLERPAPRVWLIGIAPGSFFGLFRRVKRKFLAMPIFLKVSCPACCVQIIHCHGIGKAMRQIRYFGCELQGQMEQC
jgi:hypothetical protein